MSTDKKTVLLCTGASNEISSEENRYKRNLLENNFEAEILQVLEFEFINLDELRKHLDDSESYSGLIFTSPRSALAVKKIKLETPISIESWLDKPAFCIGQATESIVREQIGLLNIFGSDSGNAKNLAYCIINTIKNCDKPLLLPCSDIAKDTISQILSERNMQIKKIITYKTKANNRLSEILNQALEKSHVLVFFSPSVLDNMIKALSTTINIFDNFKIIAIGPVTEQALLNAGIKVHGVSEKPEPKALIKVIKSVI